MTGRNRLQIVRDEVDVPILEVDGRRLDHVPGVANVKPQIVREHDLVAG
jgi:hypothetical protein